MDYFKKDDILNRIWRVSLLSQLPEGFQWRVRSKPPVGDHEIIEVVIKGKEDFDKNSMSVKDRKKIINEFISAVNMGMPISCKYNFILSKSNGGADSLRECAFTIFAIVQWKVLRGHPLLSLEVDYNDGDIKNTSYKNISNVLIQYGDIALISSSELLDSCSVKRKDLDEYSTGIQLKKKKIINVFKKLYFSFKYRNVNNIKKRIEILKWQLSGLDKSYEELEGRVKKLESLHKEKLDLS